MLSAQGIGAKDYMHSRDVLLLTTDIIKLSKAQNMSNSIVYSLVQKKQKGSNSISKLDSIKLSDKSYS